MIDDEESDELEDLKRKVKELRDDVDWLKEKVEERESPGFRLPRVDEDSDIEERESPGFRLFWDDSERKKRRSRGLW